MMRWRGSKLCESAVSCCLLLCVLVGCGQPEAQFGFNRLYMERQQSDTGIDYDRSQIQAIVNATEAMFGTPDQPHLLGSAGLDQNL